MEGLRSKSWHSAELYTQIFRAQIGFWSIAYTEARRAWIRAGPVYSDFQGPDRLLVASVYSMLEELGPGQGLYTQISRARTGSWFRAYTTGSKSLDPGRICILKFSGARPGSWSEAYTACSKSLDPGRTCILRFSGPR